MSKPIEDPEEIQTRIEKIIRDAEKGGKIPLSDVGFMLFGLGAGLVASEIGPDALIEELDSLKADIQQNKL